MNHRQWYILAVIWLVGLGVDRLWFILDQSTPAWDQADYLNGALNYWQALKTPEIFSGEWWINFWELSTKIPPLTYILTSPFLYIFGTSVDSATLVMLFYNALLVIGIYGLGVVLFTPEVGLIAAAMCQVFPGLYYYRLDYLLDLPVTATVTLGFYLMTIFYYYGTVPYLCLFALSLGIALMVKQTSLIFLLIPILWIGISSIRHKKWSRLGQLILALLMSLVLWAPWYRINWLLILTSAERATVKSAILEGDPPLNTLKAWTYYLEVLPYLLSWFLLLIPLVGLLLYVIKHKTIKLPPAWKWLTAFLVGGYLLSSVNVNKDIRYILPLLPVLSLILASGLQAYQPRWRKVLVITTLGISTFTMIGNLFPIGMGSVTGFLSPHLQRYPYTKTPYPHPQVIATITSISPYLRSTLGVLPSTPEINQHNFSFYGGLAKFQVAGRQVGVREKEISQDARSLNWFITKTGEQGSVPEIQEKMVQTVEDGGSFQRVATWELPDETELHLHHRILPSTEVTTITGQRDVVKLEGVEDLPGVSPAGVPIPVTYRWSGPWEELLNGIVIITWQSSSGSWVHDHGIGMGEIFGEHPGNFLVKERLAMLPPKDMLPGSYKLQVTYLDRFTGNTYPLNIPDISITIDPKATPSTAPELDLVTQLRTIAPGLGLGIKGLDPIFEQTARINQYDFTQDYLLQADKSLSYRLQTTSPQQIDWSYALALARVLRQDVNGAISALQKLIQLQPNNPYPYAYLGFVYLYNWQPSQAQHALQPARDQHPSLHELQALEGIASLMRGNLLQAYNLLHRSIPKFL